VISGGAIGWSDFDSGAVSASQPISKIMTTAKIAKPRETAARPFAEPAFGAQAAAEQPARKRRGYGPPGSSGDGAGGGAFLDFRKSNMLEFPYYNTQHSVGKRV
jgi:hypothetical protein